MSLKLVFSSYFALSDGGGSGGSEGVSRKILRNFSKYQYEVGGGGYSGKRLASNRLVEYHVPLLS